MMTSNTPIAHHCLLSANRNKMYLMGLVHQLVQGKSIHDKFQHKIKTKCDVVEYLHVTHECNFSSLQFEYLIIFKEYFESLNVHDIGVIKRKALIDSLDGHTIGHVKNFGHLLHH